jgi:hypothetical protein
MQANQPQYVHPNVGVQLPTYRGGPPQQFIPTQQSQEPAHNLHEQPVIFNDTEQPPMTPNSKIQYEFASKVYFHFIFCVLLSLRCVLILLLVFLSLHYQCLHTSMLQVIFCRLQWPHTHNLRYLPMRQQQSNA